MLNWTCRKSVIELIKVTYRHPDARFDEETGTFITTLLSAEVSDFLNDPIKSGKIYELYTKFVCDNGGLSEFSKIVSPQEGENVQKVWENRNSDLDAIIFLQERYYLHNRLENLDLKKIEIK